MLIAILSTLIVIGLTLVVVMLCQRSAEQIFEGIEGPILSNQEAYYNSLLREILTLNRDITKEMEVIKKELRELMER